MGNIAFQIKFFASSVESWSWQALRGLAWFLEKVVFPFFVVFDISLLLAYS